jgi:hypothetical protein
MKQRLTESELMRKYSNLIVEAEQSVQLDEGFMDSIINWAENKAQAVLAKLSPADQQSIVQMVSSVSGGKPKMDLSTIKKVADQLKPQAAEIQKKVQQTKSGQPATTQAPVAGQTPVSEGLKDLWNKYATPALAAGSVAAGYGANMASQAADKIGQAAAAAVPYPIADKLPDVMNRAAMADWSNNRAIDMVAHAVQQTAAANQASFSTEMICYALAALCVSLAVAAFLKFHNSGNTSS